MARGFNLDYPDRHPGPGDVALVVEISDSSITQNRGIRKQRVYSRAGIPTSLIVDVNSRHAELRTDPNGDAYQTLVVLSVDGARIGTIQAASLFP